jgi:hypothetical protein
MYQKRASGKMDPNYHYIIVDPWSAHFTPDAPLKTLGLPLESDEVDQWTANASIAEAFIREKYVDTEEFNKFILNMGENAKYVRVGRDFAIYRIPKELAEYSDVCSRSSGCCGEWTEYHVEMDTSKAIIDLTKKTLEDPTPEKLAHLKEMIDFFESAKVEYVDDLFGLA